MGAQESRAGDRPGQPVFLEPEYSELPPLGQHPWGMVRNAESPPPPTEPETATPEDLPTQPGVIG